MKTKDRLDLTIPKHILLLPGHCSLVFPDALSDWANAGVGVLRGDEEALTLNALCTSLKAVEVDCAIILVISRSEEASPLAPLRVEGLLRREIALLLTRAISDGIVTVPMLSQGLLECDISSI